MDKSHSKYHSSNAFCGDAGPEEAKHLQNLITELTDDELKHLVENVGITFIVNESEVNKELSRDEYENVIDEANREDFYREYNKIINSRK